MALAGGNGTGKGSNCAYCGSGDAFGEPNGELNTVDGDLIELAQELLDEPFREALGRTMTSCVWLDRLEGTRVTVGVEDRDFTPVCLFFSGLALPFDEGLDGADEGLYGLITPGQI